VADWTLTVSQLNEYVRRQLAGDPLLRSVRVEGEISGFKHHISGHKYFTLKDDKARISCVMFRQSAQTLDFTPKEGTKVTAVGSASVFVRDGTYQLYVESMRESGAGDLYQEFERRKKKLADEGLFDPAIKRPLPMMPTTVGVATASGGAAFQDIIRVSRARNPRINIVLSPCAVQGEGAAEEIARAIERLNARGGVDVILVGRGGGSIEDLWAFNEEVVARAIRASEIPVVSCVGHEIDFTIADFAADVRAATPSNGAELAVPVLEDIEDTLTALMIRSGRALKNRLDYLRARLMALRASSVFTMPGKILIENRRNALGQLGQKNILAMQKRLQKESAKLELLQRSLEALNPAAVIERGYAVVEKDGVPVASAEGLNPGEKIVLRMHGGRAEASVNAVTKEKK